MSVFSGLASLFGRTPAVVEPDNTGIHPNGVVALEQVKKRAAVNANKAKQLNMPNTLINMGPVQEQAARNASRRRANDWANQLRKETESNPALAAEMRQRMANIAAAQRAERNSNVARRAANLSGPSPTVGPALRPRLTERKGLTFPTVVEVNEVNEMNGGRRKTKSKTKAKSKSRKSKSKKHTKKSRRHK